MSVSFSSAGYRMRWAGKISLTLSLLRVVLLSSPLMTGHAEALPEELRGLTHPPRGFQLDPSRYESPLVQEDGGRTDSVAAWMKQRQKLRQQWMQLMGPWPELLEHSPLRMEAARRVDQHFEQRVQLQASLGQWIDGWLLLPVGEGPFASVLVVFYDPETSIGKRPDKPGRDFGLQLVQQGIATLNIGTPGGDAWNPDKGEVRAQPLSYYAYVAANAWLAMAQHSKLNPEQIGVAGHSYGGKWALFAAALWDRFAAVAVSDPGIVFDETRPNVNYWEPWYLGWDPETTRPARGIPSDQNPRTGAYRLMREQNRDLHTLHALIAPRPFLVLGGSEDPVDRWHALHHTVEVNRLMGQQERVFFSQRPGHAPTAQSNDQLLKFFKYFLQ